MAQVTVGSLFTGLGVFDLGLENALGNAIVLPVAEAIGGVIYNLVDFDAST